MATPIAMPRQGQSVESCVILEWNKKKGDTVAEGDVLFSYETDKASFEFESPVSGTLIEIFHEADEDVPVLENVAAVGEPGESVDEFRPSGAPARAETGAQSVPQPTAAPEPSPAAAEPTATTKASPSQPGASGENIAGISPRARNLASRKGVDPAVTIPTGPKGRIIERDVRMVLEKGLQFTRTAYAKAGAEGLSAPAGGTGIGGRVRSADLTAKSESSTAQAQPIAAAEVPDTCTDVKLTNMRKIIADRMHQSLQQSAQLTMNAGARADGLVAYRAELKKSGEMLGLANITITDLVAFAVTRVLPRFPEVNGTFDGTTLRRYDHVHLALAVDTPRGLMVPVIRFADLLTLNELAKAMKLMAQQCMEGSISPDHLRGGTITLSNLGAFGIESFTPVLNSPQVALVGVNTITPKPAPKPDGGYEIVPHIGLSLTIDHRVVDGAPGARFVNALVKAIENITLTLSL